MVAAHNECSGERRYLGERLGLYQALDTGGPATSAELAGAAAPPSGMSGNGWSIMWPAGCWRLVTRPPGRWPAGTGCLRRMCRSWPIPTTSATGHSTVWRRAGGRWLPQLVEAFRSGSAPAPLPWAPEGRAEYNRAVFLGLLVLKALRGSAIPGCPKPCADVVRSAFLAGHPVSPAAVRRTSSRAAMRTSSPRPCA